MITIPKQPLTTNYNYNQIGHFKELVAGAGSKVFKVNSAGIFAGAASYGSAPFKLSYSGALTATGVNITGAINATSGTFSGQLIAATGSIGGDFLVSGSLYSDSSGFRTKIVDGKLSFLKNTTEWAYIKTASGSNGLELATNGSIYFKKFSGTLAELKSTSALEFSTDSYISWASGRKITATSDEIQIDGDFRVSGHMDFTSDTYIRFGSGRSIAGTGTEIEIDGNLVPHENINHDLGSASRRWNNVRAGYAIIDNHIQCQGYNGTTIVYGFVRRVDHDGSGHVTSVKYGEVKTKGGIVYEISNA